MAPDGRSSAFDSAAGDMTDNNLLTLAEAAPLLRKNEGALRMWLRSRDCPLQVVNIGRRVFLRQADIDAYLGGTQRPAKQGGGRTYEDGYAQAIWDMRNALIEMER